jgi:glycosyltransferase involved in cell wall biosynthesis
MGQAQLPITVCFVSGAEEHRIGLALESVREWTSEIVVVLNAEVQDRTEEICLKHGANVYREPWKGFIGQKNSAADKATQPWVLGLDADEVVGEKLRNEILDLFHNRARLEQHDAYDFPRCTFYCGRWIRHGDWYPDRVLRLWKRGAAHWSGIEPHAKLDLAGKIGHLRHDLLHYSNERIDRQIAKIAPYSDSFVSHFREKGRRPGSFDLLVRPFWRFLRAYFFKFGFLDGWQGYYIAWLTAFSTATRYVKVLEAELNQQQQK